MDIRELQTGFVILSANATEITGYHGNMVGGGARLFTAQYASRGNLWGQTSVTTRSISGSMVGNQVKADPLGGVVLQGVSNLFLTAKNGMQSDGSGIYPNQSEFVINPRTIKHPGNGIIPISRINGDRVADRFMDSFAPSDEENSQYLPEYIGAGKYGWNDLYRPSGFNEDIITSHLHNPLNENDTPHWLPLHQYYHARLGHELFSAQKKNQPYGLAASKLNELSADRTILDVATDLEKKVDERNQRLTVRMTVFLPGGVKNWGASVAAKHNYDLHDLQRYENIPEIYLPYSEWLLKAYGLSEAGQVEGQAALF